MGADHKSLLKPLRVSVLIPLIHIYFVRAQLFFQPLLLTAFGQNRTGEILIYTNPKVLVLMARRSLLLRIAREE